MTDEITELIFQSTILRAAIDRELERKKDCENTLDALARKLDNVNIEIRAEQAGRSAAAERHRHIRVVPRQRKPIAMTIE